MSNLLFCYIPCSDSDEAARIGQEILTARLAACVNILPGIKSMYWWQGEIQTDKEVVLIVKTKQESFEEFKSLVLSHHSYDCPCIVGLPIENANESFVQWVNQETNLEKTL